MMRDRLPAPGVFAIFGLGGLVVSLFWGAVADGQVFYRRDLLVIWYPQVEAFVRAVASGSLPTWDPLASFGQPLLADPSAQVAYPLTWLNLLMRPWTYYTLSTVVHTWFSGVGVYLLARHWGLAPGSAFLAASLWITGGPLQSLVDLWHHFAGACWMPWVFLAADVALRGRRLAADLGWAAAMSGQILAGSADMCALTGCALAAYIGVLHVRWRAGAGVENRRVIGSCVVAALFALGFTALLWMPALELVSRAARRALAPEVRTYWSLHPLSLPDFVFPGVWRSLIPRPPSDFRLREVQDPFVDSIYLGIGALGLVGAALARRPARRTAVLVGVGVAAILVALGRHTPVYDSLVWLLPPLRVLRYPTKALVLAGLSWALLAGIGCEALRRTDPPRRRFWALSVVAPVLAVALASWLGLLLSGSAWGRAWLARLLAGSPAVLSAHEITAFLVQRLPTTAVLATATSILALLCAWKWRWAPWAGVATGLLAVGDLTLYHRYLDLAPRELVAYRPEILSFLPEGSDSRIFVYDYLTPGVGASEIPSPYQLARLPSGWSEGQGFALGLQMSMAWATGARWNRRVAYEDDLRGLHPRALAAVTSHLKALETTPAYVRLLRMGAVTHVITLHERGQEDLLRVATLDGAFRERIRLYRVPNPQPRAYVIAQTRILDHAAGLARMATADWDPSRELILGAGQPQLSPPSFEGTAEIRAETSDRLRLEAVLSHPGYLVLVDTYDPGWRATANGRATRVLPANLAFRAIPLPAGRHTVQLWYRPAGLIGGLATSALTAVLAAALWLADRRRRARRLAPAA
jgi:hypothetical protein